MRGKVACSFFESAGGEYMLVGSKGVLMGQHLKPDESHQLIRLKCVWFYEGKRNAVRRWAGGISTEKFVWIISVRCAVMFSPSSRQV